MLTSLFRHLFDDNLKWYYYTEQNKDFKFILLKSLLFNDNNSKKLLSLGLDIDVVSAQPIDNILSIDYYRKSSLLKDTIIVDLTNDIKTINTSSFSSTLLNFGIPGVRMTYHSVNSHDHCLFTYDGSLVLNIHITDSSFFAILVRYLNRLYLQASESSK